MAGVTVWNHLSFRCLDSAENGVLAFLGERQRVVMYATTHRDRNRQAGSSNVKSLIWLGILILFIYGCVQVVPLYFADYEFQDSMQSTARFASVNRQTPDQIRHAILKEADRLEVPVKLQDIKVTDHNGRIDITAEYSITVDFHVYQWTLNFHPTASNTQL